MRFAGVIGMLFLVAMVVGVMTKPPPREMTAEEKEATRRGGLEYAAKHVVTQSLRDPSSATFGKVFYANKAGEAVCGYVNGRNGFGGFTGMKEFVVTVKSGTIEINDGSGKFAGSWNKLCAGMR